VRECCPAESRGACCSCSSSSRERKEALVAALLLLIASTHRLPLLCCRLKSASDMSAWAPTQQPSMLPPAQSQPLPQNESQQLLPALQAALSRPSPPLPPPHGQQWVLMPTSEPLPAAAVAVTAAIPASDSSQMLASGDHSSGGPGTSDHWSWLAAISSGIPANPAPASAMNGFGNLGMTADMVAWQRRQQQQQQQQQAAAAAASQMADFGRRQEASTLQQQQQQQQPPPPPVLQVAPGAPPAQAGPLEQLAPALSLGNWQQTALQQLPEAADASDPQPPLLSAQDISAALLSQPLSAPIASRSIGGLDWGDLQVECA
jgi:hypothetical protein